MTSHTDSYCTVCRRQTMFEKQGINHVLHLLLTVFTLGLWGFVWLAVAVKNTAAHSRCTHCGHALTTPPKTVVRPA